MDLFKKRKSAVNSSGAVPPDIRYRKQLPGDVMISVWKDDLTTHKADAVVNEANEHLSYRGGLALALSRAGGPQIQQESDRIIKSQGRVPAGEAVLTTAGKLPCKHIIHAVGPCVAPNPSNSEIAAASETLEKVIWRILKSTESNNMQSVAIPAISSGLSNFPLGLCADIIVQTVRSFSEKRRPQRGPLKVRLVNSDDPSVREMLRACNKVLGPCDSQRGGTPIESAVSPDISYRKQLSGGVMISVWKDDLTNHEADAVVNEANEQLSHGGGLALALSRAGGPQIQQESDRIIKQKGRVPAGEAVLTTAGKLPCECIIHAVGPRVSPNPSNSEIAAASEMLEKVIWSIFQCTESNNMQSVAIPAISSGLYNFPLDHCADIIVHTVRSFSEKRHLQRGPLKVRLVNSDDPSVREMLRACNQVLGPPDSQRGPTPIRKSAKSPEAVQGSFGKTDMIHDVHFPPSFGAVSPEIRYRKRLHGDVMISVWKDDLTTHEADAVVNAANEQLRHGGGLALALSRAGGPQIQQESDRITKSQGRVPTGEAVLTTAGKLPCKCIIHAVGPRVSLRPTKNEIAAASEMLEKVIRSIFQCTESNNIQSVAIPAISSGIFNFPLDLCADIIVQTVFSFSEKRHPQRGPLEVRLVNNDEPSVRKMLRACDQILGPSDKKEQTPIQSTPLAKSGRLSFQATWDSPPQKESH